MKRFIPRPALSLDDSLNQRGGVRYTGSNTWVHSDTGITGSDVIYHQVTSTRQILAIGNLGAYISSDGQNWTAITGLPVLSRTYTEEIRPQFFISDANGYVYVGFSYEGLGIFRTGQL